MNKYVADIMHGSFQYQREDNSSGNSFSTAFQCNCENCSCKQSKDTTQYKYNEDKTIDEFAEYIKSTYSQHYIGESSFQAFDAWIALGSLFTSARDTAIKYLWRLGRKGEIKDTKKDIMKTMHYCLLLLYDLEKQKKE